MPHLHPAPPKLPPHLLGCWGPKNGMQGARGGSRKAEKTKEAHLSEASLYGDAAPGTETSGKWEAMLCLPHPPSRRDSGFLLLSFLQVPNWRPFILFLTVILLWLLPSLPFPRPPSSTHPLPLRPFAQLTLGRKTEVLGPVLPAGIPALGLLLKLSSRLGSSFCPQVYHSWGQQEERKPGLQRKAGPAILILKGFQERRDGSRSFSCL